MDMDVTQEIAFVGPETTLEFALPELPDDRDPWWVTVLSALVSGFIGAALAVVVLYYLFMWWVGA